MRNLLLYLFISLLFNSCNLILDKVFEPDEYFHVSEELSRLGNFQTGSYWIYHNDLLNLYDTVRVIEYSKRQTVENYDSHQRYYDLLTIKLKSTYNDSIIIDQLSAQSSYSRRYIENSNIVENIDSVGFKIISNPKYKELPLYYSYNGIVYLMYGYDLNGVTYDIVVCYTTKKQNVYYLAFNKGVIKMIKYENNNKMEWNLIKYNIVQSRV
jgi:hypothetical protein